MTRTVSLFLYAGIVAALAAAALINHFAYTESQVRLQRAESFKHSLDSRFWRRAIIESIHDSYIIVRLSALTSDARERPARIAVYAHTTIARQELTQENGVYMGLTPRRTISLQDLVPGEIVSMMLEAGEDGSFSARTILAGSPL